MYLIERKFELSKFCYNEIGEFHYRMDIDETVFDSIKQHIELHVPDVPRFKLVPTDELPENYELEPLPANETMSNEIIFCHKILI